MSLITINHSPYNDTETMFVSCGGEIRGPFVTNYVQYFNKKPVARFRVIETTGIEHKNLSTKSGSFRHGL